MPRPALSLAPDRPQRELAAERQRQALSQAELAVKVGVAQSHVSKLERGADVRLSTLLKVARTLRLEPLLVPVQLLPAVEALIRAHTGASDSPGPVRRYVPDGDEPDGDEPDGDEPDGDELGA